MTIPADWLAHCKKDKEWCTEFVREMYKQKLTGKLFGEMTTKKVEEAKMAKFKKECHGNKKCVDKDVSEYEEEYV